MRFFVFTKERLLILACCAVAVILGVSISVSSLNSVVTVSTGERKIPIYCVDEEDKKVSISFDAAWGDEQTEGLLKTLEEYEVKTTFFLVGEWVEKYPESVKAISAAGHDVENHSDTHAHLPQLSDEDILKELNDCNDRIEELTGDRPTLFRPPYGDYNNNVVEVANSIDMYTVQWDIDSLDWKDPTPETMVQTISNKLECGSIILLHNGAANTPQALPLIIESIKSQGYEIVPISELLLDGEYYTDHEGRMISTKET